MRRSSSKRGRPSFAGAAGPIAAMRSFSITMSQGARPSVSGLRCVASATSETGTRALARRKRVRLGGMVRKSACIRLLYFVMAGLVPAIHDFLARNTEDVDARHKAGHDEGCMLKQSHETPDQSRVDPRAVRAV